jgi:hypothetical protein
MDHYLNSVLLSLQANQSKDGKEGASAKSNILEPAFELIKDSVEVMTDEQRKAFMECVRSTLEKGQLIMSRDAVEWFTPQFNSAKDKPTVSSMIKSPFQAELCLRAFGLMIQKLPNSAIVRLFQTEMDLINPLLRYLREKKLRPSTWQEARKVIEVIACHTNNL